MLKREREITHPMTNARDRTDHITLVKDIMIRQGIRQIPNTANNHHHQQLPTPERLHIPHTQQQAEQRDERQEVDLRHPLSPPRPRGRGADDGALFEVGGDRIGRGVGKCEYTVKWHQ